MAGPPIVRLRVIAHAAYRTDCRTRIPFRFGVHTMTEAPLALVEVVVEAEDGRRACGWASELVVPKWFDKSPERTIEQERAALLAGLADALEAAVEAGDRPRTVFEIWQHCWAKCGEPAGRAGGLLAGFGTALVERAMLDALCRLLGAPFAQVLRSGATGFEAAALDPALGGLSLNDALPTTPSSEIIVRHTVGLTDPLSSADVAAGERVDDGLPQTLVEDIRHYGFDHFKIKLGGASDADIGRLLAIARILAAEVPSGARFTLDANEQFEDIGQLVSVLERVRSSDGGADFLAGLLAIEQPLPRALSFDADRNREMPALRGFAPALIDEADGFPGAFREALALGYLGVSFKNCKGVFRALGSAMLCKAHGEGAFQSAEDLTNLPLVPLNQDLCMVATLGLPHVERNGHHYFRGLDHLSAEQAAAAAQAHPNLYGPLGDGYALLIRDGKLDLRSLQCAGFGVGLRPETASLPDLFPA